MGPTSFGLGPEHRTYILEEVFLLMEHCHFSFDEAWALPVVYRKWFIARKDRANKEQAEGEKRNARSAPKPPPRKAAAPRR